MSESNSCTGFILRKKDLPHYDQVIVAFSREYGKIAMIAKGVRKSTSKRSAHLQTGNLLKIQVLMKTNLSVLQQTNLVSAFGGLKEDYLKIKFLYAALFVLDHILPELQPEPEVYTELQAYISYLSKHNDQTYLARFYKFLEKILEYLGFLDEEEQDDLIGFTEQVIDAKIPLHDII
jgi:DNA repair protein RecO (recombination protein O)